MKSPTTLTLMKREFPQFLDVTLCFKINMIIVYFLCHRNIKSKRAILYTGGHKTAICNYIVSHALSSFKNLNAVKISIDEILKRHRDCNNLIRRPTVTLLFLYHL